jgi:arylsulfatase A-like enzyme
VVFRNAFSAAPVCSPSRAALLTGEPGKLLGLAHRGFRLPDYGRHLVHALTGYTSRLVGEQHIAADAREIGYDEISSALEPLPPEPFFLDVGFHETHRPFPAAAGEALPPAHLPDVPEIRRDMAGFVESARRLDERVGEVLGALPENTLVILTTDHGLAFPGAKATLTDRGIGVMLVIRGPGFAPGVDDRLVSQLDLYPTICELAGVPPPPWLVGRSLLAPGENDAVFAELTFHAAYEPQRAVRTKRYKYIRRFGDRDAPVLANIDDSPSKDYLLAHGLADRRLAREELYDLLWDPGEAHNLAPERPPVLDELRARLDRWMQERQDPLLDGPVAPPPGAELNLPTQLSPEEPTWRAGS